MKRKIIALIIAVIMIAMLCGCDSKGITSNELGFVYNVRVYTFKDEVTGVWYMTTNQGGVTPRLCPDGSLYVD